MGSNLREGERGKDGERGGGGGEREEERGGKERGREEKVKHVWERERKMEWEHLHIQYNVLYSHVYMYTLFLYCTRYTTEYMYTHYMYCTYVYVYATNLSLDCISCLLVQRVPLNL